MKKVATILVLSAMVAAAAPPRVAVVRVSDVFKQLESTAKANEELQIKREKIKADQRLVDYKKMYADLELRGKQLSGKDPELDPATREKLEREFAIKRQEAKSLFDDIEAFRAARTQEINAEMVAGMRERLEGIREVTEKLAKEEGYDWIFDSSGNTNTGVPLLLYAKNPDDLTDQVLAILGKATTPPEQETTAGKDSAGKER